MRTSPIVKVQVPLNWPKEKLGDIPDAYVYDKDRSVEVFLPATPHLLELMDGKVKKFFFADTSKRPVELLEEAPWQEW